MTHNDFKILKNGWILYLVVCSLALQTPAQPSLENYELVWSDEFDGTGLPNASNWSYEEGYVRNNELQYYTKERTENAHLENGLLMIEARKDNWNGNEYTSASLHTNGKRTFQYGIFEMRAKIDVRAGSWPAFWTLGVSEEWPSNGEVDIMEYYNGLLHANVGWGTETRWSANWYSKTKAVGSDFSNDFHIWRMKWTEDSILLYVDDILMNTIDLKTTINGSISSLTNPFHQPVYILINQAIGSSGGDPSSTTFPVSYAIDYVRVYQKTTGSTNHTIQYVTSSANGRVSILFSQIVEKQSAEIIANFSIRNSTGKFFPITSASLQKDGRTLILTTSNLIEGDSITLDVINLGNSTSHLLYVNPAEKKITGKVIGLCSPWNNNSSVGFEAAMDGNVSTYSDCSDENTWVGYDFGALNQVEITGIQYTPRSGYADRMNGRTIEVSNDGVTWDVIHTIEQTPLEGTNTSEPIVYPKPVRYIRYNGSGAFLNVSEIQYVGVYSIPKTTPSITVKHESHVVRSNTDRLCFYDLSGKKVVSRKLAYYPVGTLLRH